MAQGRPAAFAAYAAPHAILFAGADVAVGPEAIRSAVAATVIPGEVLEGQPVIAGVGQSGDRGVTVGRYIYSAQRGGRAIVSQGKYLTVWERTPQGEWRWVVDAGSPDTLPPGAAP